jgi:hypothetical protein
VATGKRHWWNRERDAPENGPAPTPPQAAAVQAPPSAAPQIIGTRSRQEVERLRDLVSADLAEDEAAGREVRWEDTEWCRGIVAAAQWVLAEGEWAPVTGAYTPGGPDTAALRAEDYAADDVACRRRNIPGISSSFANGVQHTVMWVRGDTDERPWFE